MEIWAAGPSKNRHVVLEELREGLDLNRNGGRFLGSVSSCVFEKRGCGPGQAFDHGVG